MSRLFAFPLLWLSLCAMWLLLSRSITPGAIVLAVIVASIGCLAAAAVEAPRSRIRKFGLVLKLIGLVLADIFRSNINVIRLSLSRTPLQSAFVTIPLALRDPNGLAILACIITATPGSAWINYNARLSTVVIHVLDTGDPDAWVETVRHNYEALLLEIFQ